MSTTINTKRLYLRPLYKHDSSFILELMNTEGWLRFIGDRNIRSTDDAEKYIATIQAAPGITYQVVCRQEDNRAIGIITRIQRDYLPGPDIGFAFLDAYEGHGYAFEAASAVMAQLQGALYAIIDPLNGRSEKLLRRLSFNFDRERDGANGTDHIYSYRPGT